MLRRWEFDWKWNGYKKVANTTFYECFHRHFDPQHHYASFISYFYFYASTLSIEWKITMLNTNIYIDVFAPREKPIP